MPMPSSADATDTWFSQLWAWCICLLSLLVGLHPPRAFALLYLLAALLLLRIWRQSSMDLRARWPLLLLTVLFSISYSMGMLLWNQWTWSEDRADLVNALILPVLLMTCGFAAGGRNWKLPTRILVGYAIGALIFAVLTLAVNRDPWWNVTQSFEISVLPPWGTATSVNVRSVEQNAMPSLLLLPVSVVALVQARALGRRPAAAWLGLPLGLLGLHCIASFQGSLGMVVLVLAIVPWIGIALHQLAGLRPRFWPLAVLAGAISAVAIAWPRLLPKVAPQTGWGQGLCDERFSLFVEILKHAGRAPWGGRQLEVPFQNCDGSRLTLAMEGGNVSMAHNVVLDVFLDVGLIPSLLLISVMFSLLLPVLRGFIQAWRRRAWDWTIGLQWGWLVLLGCQWSFQPLISSDRLLYYFSFFVLAMMAAQLNRPKATALADA